jgi:hypothetical protein
MGMCVAAHSDGATDSTAAVAAPWRVSTEVDLVWISKYIWRGTVANPDPSFQPSVTISTPEGLSYNFWTSIDTTNIHSNNVRNNRGNITEIDHTLNYTWSQAKCLCSSWNVGYIDYTFPNTSFAPTSELYANTCFGGPLSPALGVNWDIHQVKGFYFNASAGYNCTMHINKKMPTNLNLTAKLGYGTDNFNRFYFGVDKSAFDDFVLTASVPYTLNKIIKITPAISYSTVVDSSLRDALAASGAHADNLFGGVTVAVTF